MFPFALKKITHIDRGFNFPNERELRKTIIQQSTSGSTPYDDNITSCPKFGQNKLPVYLHRPIGSNATYLPNNAKLV